ncbi:MAG: hypothetical protein QME70_09600 [Bacillota bacterium]|nr:hypothetical protein [Bacillota bacterium]
MAKQDCLAAPVAERLSARELERLMREPPRPGRGGLLPGENTWTATGPDLKEVLSLLTLVLSEVRLVKAGQETILAALAQIRAGPRRCQPSTAGDQLRLPL